MFGMRKCMELAMNDDEEFDAEIREIHAHTFRCLSTLVLPHLPRNSTHYHNNPIWIYSGSSFFFVPFRVYLKIDLKRETDVWWVVSHMHLKNVIVIVVKTPTVFIFAIALSRYKLILGANHIFRIESHLTKYAHNIDSSLSVWCAAAEIIYISAYECVCVCVARFFYRYENITLCWWWRRMTCGCDWNL